MTDVAPHLGGHGNSTNLDPGALDYLLGYIDPPVRNVLDIGAGMGGMAELGRVRGIPHWITVDGDERTHPYILHDFTAGPMGNAAHFSLGWCVEFLEHVEAQYLGNVFSALCLCDWVVCTAAPPGWGGHHHVNEQELDYWFDEFDLHGFDLDTEATNGVRKASNMTIHKPNLVRPIPKPFMLERGMVYRKR